MGKNALLERAREEVPVAGVRLAVRRCCRTLGLASVVMSGDRQVAVVHRTARVGVRCTRAQADRLYGLLRDAGDVWAALVELNRDASSARRRRRSTSRLDVSRRCRWPIMGLTRSGWQGSTSA